MDISQQVLNDVATTTGPIGSLVVAMWLHFASVLSRIEKRGQDHEKRITILEVKNGITESAAE